MLLIAKIALRIYVARAIGTIGFTPKWGMGAGGQEKMYASCHLVA